MTSFYWFCLCSYQCFLFIIIIIIIISLSKTMRNGFYGCNEYSHNRLLLLLLLLACQKLCEMGFMVVMNILILGRMMLSALNTSSRLITKVMHLALSCFTGWHRGSFLLRTYPLSEDPIITQRWWERLTNRRTCGCENRISGTRDSEIRILKLSFRTKEPRLQN